MSGSGGRIASDVFRCRQTFTLSKDKLNYYPGHMPSGLRKMQARLAKVDCFLEIHDARIPFSGRNPAFFHKLTAIRPHVLVFNKMDMAPKENREEIRDIIMRKEPHLADVVWTDAKIQWSLSIKSLMSLVTEAIERKAIHNLKPERNIMMIGIPNTGKSSVLNAMRRTYTKKGNIKRSVQPHAGATRSVQERVKLLDNPLTFCYDTPGICQPVADDVETAMRIAACGCVKDDEVGLENIVDYILYFLNKRGMFDYVSYYGLEEPTDDVYVLLTAMAKNLGWTRRVRNIITNTGGYKRQYDTRRCAEYFIKQYRSGELGEFLLDEDKLEEERAKLSRLGIAPGYQPLSIGDS